MSLFFLPMIYREICVCIDHGHYVKIIKNKYPPPNNKQCINNKITTYDCLERIYRSVSRQASVTSFMKKLTWGVMGLSAVCECGIT